MGVYKIIELYNIQIVLIELMKLKLLEQYPPGRLP